MPFVVGNGSFSNMYVPQQPNPQQGLIYPEQHFSQILKVKCFWNNLFRTLTCMSIISQILCFRNKLFRTLCRNIIFLISTIWEGEEEEEDMDPQDSFDMRA
jgi:hypothetical protein